MGDEQSKPPITKVKHIDFATGKFEANGKTYHLSQDFTIERFALYQMFEIESGYGNTFAGVFQRIDEGIAHLNKMALVDGIVTFTDLQRGMQLIEQKEPFVLKICALCMNLEGEDVRYISDDQITAKIDDWKEEGIDMRDFFRYALNTMDGFIQNYNKVTQSILSLGRMQDEAEEQLKNR